MSMYDPSVPERLRLLRVTSGLSREQLAVRALGPRHPGNNIGRIERGVSKPNEVTFKKIAFALGVTPRFLAKGYYFTGKAVDGWRVDDAFPLRLGKLMREQSVDVHELSVRLNMRTEHVVQDWLVGKVAPRPESVKRVALALGVTAVFLATGAESAEPPKALDEIPFGKRIELVRRAAKMTRQEFGTACGIKVEEPANVYREIGIWEKGRGRATPAELEQIAKTMGVDLTWLSHGVNPKVADQLMAGRVPGEGHPALAAYEIERQLPEAGKAFLDSIRFAMLHSGLTGPEINRLRHAFNEILMEKLKRPAFAGLPKPDALEKLVSLA